MTRRTENKYAKGLLALGLVLGAGAAPTLAQPGFGNRGGQDEADYRQLTPEQQEMLAEQVRDFAREQMNRLMLSNAGFTDKAVQDAVVAFANEQSKAMAKLSDQNTRLRMGLREQNAPANQLSTLLNDLNTAVETENARRKTALDALDAKINFRKQPRLEAVLTTMGLVGDEMAVAGLSSGAGGFGGFGGGFGGSFGGRGFGGFGGGGDFGGRGFGGREGGGDQGGRGFGGGEGRGERGGREGRGGGEGRGGREGREGRGGREGNREGREGNREGREGNREGRQQNREAA